jgi:hypothetical protein
MWTSLMVYFLLREVSAVGLATGPRLEAREQLAPGAPPMLAFRYLDGRRRGRFGGLDLVLDDAGH